MSHAGAFVGPTDDARGKVEVGEDALVSVWLSGGGVGVGVEVEVREGVGVGVEIGVGIGQRGLGGKRVGGLGLEKIPG